MRDSYSHYKKLYMDAEKRFLPINKFLKIQTVNNGEVLEVGCGSGWFLNILNKHAPSNKYYGIEIFKRKAKYAQKMNPEMDIRVADALNLPFKKDYFDVVVCNQIIEHVKGPQKLLAELRRVLKPNGKMYFATPNRWFPIEVHHNVPFIHWLPNSFTGLFFNLEYERIYSKRTIQKWITSYGFEIKHDLMKEWIKEPKGITIQKGIVKSLNKIYKILGPKFVDFITEFLPQFYVLT